MGNRRSTLKINLITKGDRFFVPDGKKHGAFVHAGYACIMFFDQKDRYQTKTRQFEMTD